MVLKLSRTALMLDGNEGIHVIFHRSDLDGKCGGAIIRYYCEEILGRTPNMIPMDYGDPLDWVKDIIYSGTSVVTSDTIRSEILPATKRNENGPVGTGWVWN